MKTIIKKFYGMKDQKVISFSGIKCLDNDIMRLIKGGDDATEDPVLDPTDILKLD